MPPSGKPARRTRPTARCLNVQPIALSGALGNHPKLPRVQYIHRQVNACGATVLMEQLLNGPAVGRRLHHHPHRLKIFPCRSLDRGEYLPEFQQRVARSALGQRLTAVVAGLKSLYENRYAAGLSRRTIKWVIDR